LTNNFPLLIILAHEDLHIIREISEKVRNL